MDRRAFLMAAGGLAAASLAPGAALASLPVEAPGGEADRRVLRFVERTRRRREGVYARTLRRLGRDGTDPVEAAWARSTAAMAAIDRLPRLPMADQAHPAFQALARELVADVGAGMRALRGLFDAVVEVDEEPEPEAVSALFTHNAGVLASETELSEAGRKIGRGSSDALRADVEAEGLLQVTRREARRMRRLVDLSERIAGAEGRTGVLTLADPRVADEVAVGRHRWSQVAGDAEAPSEGPLLTGLEVLGIIACGLAGLALGFIVFVAIACAIACDAPGLLAVALLGGLLIAGCIAGIVHIVRRAKARRAVRQPDPPPPMEVPRLPGLDGS